MMFKVLVLQSLYALSDEQAEYQIRDRLTFQRFLGLTPESRIPDEKTIWVYREMLKERKLHEKLFVAFGHALDKRGYTAKKGTVIDARLVEVPRQRNSREENQTIKEGLIPSEWREDEPKKAQKDTQARWTYKEWQKPLWIQKPHRRGCKTQIHTKISRHSGQRP